MQSGNSLLRLDQWLTILLLAIALLFEGSFEPVPKDYFTPVILPQIEMADLPARTKLNSASPSGQLTAKSYIVVDRQSGSVLSSQEPDLALYPASTTKMITALIAAATFEPTEVWELSAADLLERSNTGFQIGDRVRVGDVIATLLIQSDNAAAELLANRFPGGKVGFLGSMSKWATYHGLTHQIFIDPAGFDAETQLVSARDLAIVGKEILNHPYLAEIVSRQFMRIPVEREGRAISLPIENTNKILNPSGEGTGLKIFGIKTGTTPAAGEVLVTAASKNGHDILVVVMGSADRFGETYYLLDSTYRSYTWQSLK